MNADRVIAAEEVVAVAAVVTGDVLAQGTNRGLPNPRRLIALFLFYGLLSWTAALGQQAARVSAAVGGLVTLTMLLGPAGAGLARLLNNLTAFAQTPAGSKPQPPQSSGAGVSIGSVFSGLWGAIQKLIPGIGSVPGAASGLWSAVSGAFGTGNAPPPYVGVGPVSGREGQTARQTGGFRSSSAGLPQPSSVFAGQ